MTSTMSLSLLLFVFLLGQVTARSEGGLPGPTAPPLKMCDSPVDIAFVIDTSSSIGNQNFNQQIRFVHDIVSMLNIGPGPKQSRVAAVSFSNKLVPQFGFNQYQSERDVLQAIDSINYDSGDATRMYLGLAHVHNTIFVPGNGERPGIENVVVVLTDGKTNAGSYDPYPEEEGKEVTQTEASRIKSLPAKVFAIGVGSDVDQAEIKGMASRPSARYAMFVDSYGKLNTNAIKNAVLTKVCEELPQESPPCTETKADVFFVIDESTSLNSEANFHKELRFVGEVIDAFPLSPSEVRVGLMTFSTNPRMKFHLNDFKTKTEIAGILKTAAWTKGDTYMDKAFKMLMEEGLDAAHGSRSNIPQIAVVITDGESTNPYATKQQVAKMKSKNFKVFAIGVGPNLDLAELQNIAGDSRRVFTVDSLDGLEAIRKELLTEVCQGDQPAPPVITCTGLQADIMLVADASSSIGHQGFDDLKSFAKNMVEKFTIGPKDIQLGLITFSDNAKFEFNLNTYRDGDEVEKALTNTHYTTGNTNTHRALQLLIDQGFTRSNGGRSGVPKIAIVITDGESRESSDTIRLANKAKQNGIMMFSIGVGPHIRQSELYAIASDPKSKYSYHVNDYASLNTIVNSLATRTCTAVHSLTFKTFKMKP